jgi:hypothetical protein
MDSGYSSIMEELKQIQEKLIKQIEEAEQCSGAEQYRRELRTSRAALKGINQLLARAKIA